MGGARLLHHSPGHDRERGILGVCQCTSGPDPGAQLLPLCQFLAQNQEVTGLDRDLDRMSVSGVAIPGCPLKLHAALNLGCRV